MQIAKVCADEALEQDVKKLLLNAKNVRSLFGHSVREACELLLKPATRRSGRLRER
jgi:hypothetical protein